MATAAASLSVPAPADEAMDMSSPAHGSYDDMIDFDDFTTVEPAQNAQHDDSMMDDSEAPRPATATDDMMQDDALDGDLTVVQEEEMQDSPAHVRPAEDEELIDYSDDELPDEIVHDAPPKPEAAEQTLDAFPSQEEDVDEEIARHPDHAVVDQVIEATDAAEAARPADSTLAALPESEHASPVPDESSKARKLEHAGDHIVSEESSLDAGAGEHESYDHVPYDEEPFEDQAAEYEEESHHPTISLDTTSQDVIADGPPTPTDTGLHAMTVRFGDLQVPLFKSRNQPEGLLKNDNLASLGLGELMQNCRQRLSLRTGETIPEAQDLVLSFDQLGLVLIEGSSAAFDCSLAEVLDVYLQLHRNDGTEDIPPFLLTLSLQMKFTRSISVLKQAAAGGSGMLSFGFNHDGEEAPDEYDADADHHGQYDEAGFDDHYDESQAADEHGDKQRAPPEGPTSAEQELDTNDNYAGLEHQQNEYNHEEDYYDGNEEYYGEDQNQDHDPESAEYEDQTTFVHYDRAAQEDDYVEHLATGAQHAPDIDTTGEYHTQTDVATTDVYGKTASTASSTTVQGDAEQDTTGEYKDEDLIDWDDDSDLTSASEATTNCKVEEDATWATEFEDHEAAENGGLEQDLTSIAAQQDWHAADEQNHDQDGVPEPGLETFLAGQEIDQDADNIEQEQHAGHPQQTAEQQSEGEHNVADDRIARPEESEAIDNQLVDDGEQLFDEADLEEHVSLHSTAKADVVKASPSAATEQRVGIPDVDFIDFGEDDEEAAQPLVKPLQASAGTAGTRTPTTKRSYDALAGDDFIDFDSPEPKKVKPS